MSPVFCNVWDQKSSRQQYKYFVHAQKTFSKNSKQKFPAIKCGFIQGCGNTDHLL